MSVERVEKEIGSLLAALEKETGDLVDRIEIRDVDVTNIKSTREEIVRRVHIYMKRIPWASW